MSGHVTEYYFSIRTRTGRLSKHGLALSKCKGASLPSPGAVAKMEGLGSPEAVGPTVDGPKQERKQDRTKDKPTQCTGTGPCRGGKGKTGGKTDSRERCGSEVELR